MGPTASGKSAVALRVACELGDVEIVTVDSMQVYRGMDIGTAKPGPTERAAVAHHLVDLAEPAQEWSVADWVAAARDALAGIEARGHRALLVGGTGLYFQALVDGLELPGRFPEAAAELARDPDTAGLYRRLTRLDAAAAARIEPGNRRRILRALEVIEGSGRPFSGFGPGVAAFPPTAWRLAGLWLPRTVLARRIEARLRAMVEAGLVEEVRGLAERGGFGRSAGQALGYREVLRHLQGQATLEGALDETLRRTRAFSRRQRMWWRRDPRIAWVGSAADPLTVVPALLGDWSER